MKLPRQGFNIIEASFVLAALVAGILMMQIYLKRAIQGRLRSLSDGLSETQYSPGRINSALRTDIRVDNLDTAGLGWSSSSLREVRVRGGSETIYGREN